MVCRDSFEAARAHPRHHQCRKDRRQFDHAENINLDLIQGSITINDPKPDWNFGTIWWQRSKADKRHIQVWRGDDLVGKLFLGIVPQKPSSSIAIAVDDTVLHLLMTTMNVEIPHHHLAAASRSEAEDYVNRVREAHDIPDYATLQYDPVKDVYEFSWEVLKVEPATHELLFDSEHFEPV